MSLKVKDALYLGDRVHAVSFKDKIILNRINTGSEDIIALNEHQLKLLRDYINEALGDS